MDDIDDLKLEDIEKQLENLSDDRLRNGYTQLLKEDAAGSCIPEFNDGGFYAKPEYYEALTEFEKNYLITKINSNLTKSELAEILYSAYQGYGLCTEDIEEMIRKIKCYNLKRSLTCYLEANN